MKFQIKKTKINYCVAQTNIYQQNMNLNKSILNLTYKFLFNFQIQNSISLISIFKFKNINSYFFPCNFKY